MSAPTLTLDELILRCACERCGAESGDPCVTANGNVSRFPHGRRGEDVIAGWLYGREQMRDMLYRHHMSDPLDFRRCAAYWVASNVGPRS
jgi:hypothetical protein